MKLRAADLFCGAGGTSIGAHATGGVSIKYAVNHWDRAIETHSANFPQATHFHSRIDQVNPRECSAIDLLFASPECTHHSKARGGRPTSDQQRAGAWHIMPWVEHHRMPWIVIENVTEFRDWGPVGSNGIPLQSKRGAFFEAWLMAIRAAGYKVDHRELNAADFGAATSRNRLFVIARKGNRGPVFPEPTHSKTSGGELPGMRLQRWRAASEVIDWSIPCPSIFSRRIPLAEKTLSRIQAGLKRFVGPFVAQWDNHNGNGHYVRNLAGPLGTFTTKANMGLVVPFLADVNHDGQDRVYSVDSALGTMTAKNGKALVLPWLSHYYGTDNVSPIGDPVDTITTKDRHSLCVAQFRDPSEWPAAKTEAMVSLQKTMRDLGVCDIGFRMLSNPELAAAQGFNGDYKFCGGKAEITRQIGNSVSPNVAEAITRAILSV